MRHVAAGLAVTVWAFAAGLSWAENAVSGGGSPSASDANVERFLMEGTEIQGTLEKPHVVYVVPWKDTSSVDGDIPLRRSFQQELLEPVDRAQFQRQRSHAPGIGGPAK
jgi:hypothetical protein